MKREAVVQGTMNNGPEQWTVMNNHGATYIFSKIYIFRFADFNGMLNENVKQNIVNSMGREDLNGCTIQDL